MRYAGLGINHTIYNFSDDMHTASTAKAVFISPASFHCIFLLSTSAVCALSNCHRRRGVGDNSAGAYWLWDAHLYAVFCVMEVCVCVFVCVHACVDFNVCRLQEEIGKDSSVNVGTQHDGCVGRGLVRRARS